MALAERSATPEQPTTEIDERLRGESEQPVADDVLADVLALLEARSLPPEELVRTSIRTITRLRKDGYVTDEEAAVLLEELVAASVGRHLSDVFGEVLGGYSDSRREQSRWTFGLTFSGARSGGR